MCSTASNRCKRSVPHAALAALIVLGLLIPGCDRFTPAPRRPPAKGPLRVHALNPRYLDDGSGKALLLVGSHTWSNLLDEGETDPPEPFDFDAYLQMLVDHNHNFMRLWRLEPAAYRYAEDDDPGERIFTAQHPWPRTGPGTALDDKPRFDLMRFDDAYFERLRRRAQQAGERGIYVGIMLFEGHALSHAAEAWSAHPFNKANNSNGIDGDANDDGRGLETHTLGDEAVLAVQRDYVRKVIETVNDLDNVLFEICNESHPESHAWQKYMVDFIHSVERTMAKQHLTIHSTPFGGENALLEESPAEIIAPNKVWAGERIPLRDDPPAAGGGKVLMLDTDHLWGCGGEAAWVFKAFTRGYHAIYMDPWQDGGYCGKPDTQMRRNLGYALRFADRIDLANMIPRSDLASTRFCLAHPGREYLIYLPGGTEVEVDLRAATESDVFQVEWFDPRRGETRAGEALSGGHVRRLRSPFPEAILHMRSFP